MSVFRHFIRLSIVVSIIAITTPSVAKPQITNGTYISEYPANYHIEIKNGSYILAYDGGDEPEPSKPVPRKVFKAVIPGVFYSKGDKKYYCLFNNAIEQTMVKRKLFVCTGAGWTKGIITHKSGVS